MANKLGFDFIVDLYRRFSEDAGSFLAATISYYALFSIFPLLLVAISIAGYVVTYADKTEVLRYTSGVFPQFSKEIAANIRSIAANRRSTGLVGLVVLMWSGAAVFEAIEFALNKVWKVPVGRHFILSKLLSLASVIAVIVLLLSTTLISVGYETFQNYWRAVFTTNPPLAALWLSAFLGGLVITFLALVVIYSVVPNLKLGLRDVWPGAAFAAIAWEAAKRLFAIYISRAARFNAVYGSVGAFVGLLFWLYITGVILVLGAEINAALAGRTKSP
ncbi:MAG: YihY/virulence factor BrkB family protein [Actinomycetota bacterium]|nr:YihY/virulence factor BrkB family protein [Actinomycetota bacterium]